MATIEKRVGRRSVSYRITVSDGYDGNYKKIRRRKTWRVPEGWSEKRAEKEVQKIALEFEQKIRQGYEIDNRKTFGEYAEYVIGVKERAGVKHNTILSYQYLLRGVREKIGNMKLVDIRPFHLNELYRSLQEKGLRCTESKVHIAMDLGAFLKEHKISRASLSREAGVSHTTVTSACCGNKIFRQQAEKMAKALGKRVEELFVADERTVKLAPKTIREYHQFIRVVLAQAEREMIVPYNAADKATPPRRVHTTANYFQPDVLGKILRALEDEPMKWRVITHLLIVTGCRRGEIMGLHWSKVDWVNQRIKIDNNLLYAKDRGIYEGTTKTENIRYIRLPEETMELLREYKSSQEELRIANGDRWYGDDFVFTRDDGRPMHPDSITNWLDLFSKRRGLPHINPHAFRHTVASMLIADGLDMVTVSHQLGHTKVSTTDDYYAHVIEDERSKKSACVADIMLRTRETT